MNETATEPLITEADQPSTEKEKDGLKRMTLPELGPNLPLGFYDSVSDSYQRAIEVKRWTLRKEKELGEMRKQHPDVSLGEYVSMLLAEMCTRLGPHDFGAKSLNDNEKRLILNQMWQGDVLGAYCWLRYKAMGHELRIRLECPYHDYKFTWVGDLNTLEMVTAESLEAFKWEMELREPFVIRSQEAKTLGLGPARWHAIEQAKLGRRVNPSLVKVAMTPATIHSVNGQAMELSGDELGEMCKLDLENHIAEIDRHALGPDLMIEPTCTSERCERTFETSIDWSYDNFFSVSSR